MVDDNERGDDGNGSDASKRIAELVRDHSAADLARMLVEAWGARPAAPLAIGVMLDGLTLAAPAGRDGRRIGTVDVDAHNALVEQLRAAWTVPREVVEAARELLDGSNSGDADTVSRFVLGLLGKPDDAA